MTFDQITEAAMALTDDDKAKLVDVVLASLDPNGQRRTDQEWAEEIERRIDEIHTDRVTARPADEVMRELRAKYSPPDP
jgi:putative addiction module component (TIGR02574 family)